MIPSQNEGRMVFPASSVLELNLELWGEYLQYFGAVKSWLEALSYIGEKYSIYEEVRAVCDGSDELQRHLGGYRYTIRIIGNKRDTDPG